MAQAKVRVEFLKLGRQFEDVGISAYFGAAPADGNGPTARVNCASARIRISVLNVIADIAALRIAGEFGCDAIGIQYQQGLKDLTPASDLIEGLLINDRPLVSHAKHGRVLYANRALPHFNEVHECAGVDALITNRVWTKLNLDPEATLHDIRFGEQYNGDFVGVFEISGAAPPSHFVWGYRGASAARPIRLHFFFGGYTRLQTIGRSMTRWYGDRGGVLSVGRKTNICLERWTREGLAVDRVHKP